MGVVVPAVERSPILACSFSSRKYPHRAPAGKELLRVFVGGARRPELAEMDDGELRPLVLGELARLLLIRGEPCYCRIAHWPGTMPQYHVGHLELVGRIEARVAALPESAIGRQRLSRRGHSRLHPRRRTGGRTGAGRADKEVGWDEALVAVPPRSSSRVLVGLAMKLVPPYARHWICPTPP